VIPVVSKLCSRFRASRYEKALSVYQDRAGEKEAIRLARALLALQRGSEAIAMITQARRAFPHSTLLKNANVDIRRRHARILLRQALMDLTRDKTAENYIRVSELSRTVGKLRKAFAFLREARTSFPDHWGVYFSLGKTHFDRFSLTGKPQACSDCVECLQHAMDLNPNHYATLFYLGMALVRLNNYRDARLIVDSILSRSPDDAKALSLSAYIEKLESGHGTTVTHPSFAPAGGKANIGLVAPKSTSQELVQSLKELSGALGFFLLDETGELIDRATRDTALFDFNDCAAPLQALTTGCRFDAERIGIGSLYSCFIASDDWQIVVRGAENIQLVAFCDRSADDEAVDTVIDNILSMVSAA
jgi:tetratricopeptide (TPR) repeat protein